MVGGTSSSSSISWKNIRLVTVIIECLGGGGSSTILGLIFHRLS